MKFFMGFLFALFSLNLLVSSVVFAQVAIPTGAEYRSGRELCEVDLAPMVAHERGFYTAVPLDHSVPHGEKTEIYAFFAEPFDPKKNTLFYFNGGPGAPIHSSGFQASMEFNILMIEQRGNACSRPRTWTQYLNPDFYSSAFVAKDAEVIRESLKLSRITVYGVSYGTIPATIYASLFPQTTRALILEGTLFSGDGRQWAHEDVRALAQSLLDSLPENIRELLETIHSVHGVQATWFHQIFRNRLMFNEGIATFRSELLRLDQPEEWEVFVTEAKHMVEPARHRGIPLFEPNDIPYTMLACKELRMGAENLPMNFALKNGKLFPVMDPQSSEDCQTLRARANHFYDGSAYPVLVPTTYFQGAHDPATVASGAFKHFHSVARGPRQMLLLERGGHNPNLTALGLIEGGQTEIFHSAFYGKKISAEALSFAKKNQPLQWQHTHSGF